MAFNKSLDDLIEAGWHLIDTDYDEKAYYFWKEKAHEFFSDFVGPDHIFTKDLKNFVPDHKYFEENPKPQHKSNII